MSPIDVARDALLAARGKAGTAAMPDLSLEDAYHVQAAVRTALDAPVGAWKVTIVGGRAAAAPIAAASIVSAGSEVPAPAGTRIESELAFLLGRDLPPRPAAYSREDILDAVAGVHAAFEICCARLGEPPTVSFPAFLADDLGNAGMVLGGSVPSVTALPGHAALRCDGSEIAGGAHPLGDPLAALVAWANDQQDACGGLRAGQHIITGSFTGAPLVEPGCRYDARFEDGSAVAVVFQRSVGQA